MFAGFAVAIGAFHASPARATVSASATFPEYPSDINPDPWTVGTLYAGWSEEGGFDVGGVVSLIDGSGLQAGTVYLGYGALGSGSLSASGDNPITGEDSRIQINDTLVVGEAGAGNVSVSNGGDMTTGVAVLGKSGFFPASGRPAEGEISVDGPESLWTTGAAYVGLAGIGEVTVVGGGRIESGDTYLGYLHPAFAESGRGTVLVRTAGVWDCDGLFSVGYQGVGNLQIQSQGSVESKTAHITQEFNLNERSIATIENAGSVWTIDETLVVGGELHVRAGGKVQNGGDAQIHWAGNLPSIATVEGAGSRWENAATLAIGPNGSIGELHVKDGGVVTALNGYVQNGFAYVHGVGSRWSIQEQLHVGRMGNSAYMEVFQGGLAECQYAFIGTFSGSGELRVADAGTRLHIAQDMQIGGDFAGEDNTLLVLGAEVEVGHTLVVARFGEVLLQAGSRLAADQISLTAIDSSFAFNGGRLETKAFNGDLENIAGGTFAPGHAATFPGGSTANSPIDNYRQDGISILEIEIGGINAGSQYDRLNVGGHLQLGGELQVKLIDGFMPTAGDSFDVLNWTSLAGTFDAISLPPTPDSLSWNISQLYVTGVLSVTAGLPGDYNQDGSVDAADYTVWRDHLGSATALANDDTPGVGADDYTRWKTNFGNIAGTSSSAPAGTRDSGSAGGNVASVPEPGSLVTWLVLTLAISAIRRR